MDKKQKKHIVAEVVNKSGDKSYKVKVTYRTKHPVYKKVINLTKYYIVHSENQDFKTGDFVNIVSVRPISKTKSWLIKGLSKASL